MSDADSFLSTYYLSLFEFVGAIVFLVIFKVVMLLVMEKMSRSLADDPHPEDLKAKKKVIHIPIPYRIVKHSIATFLLISGLLQIRPNILFVQPATWLAHQQVGVASPYDSFLTLFMHHGMWINIWSVVIQLSLAGLLWSFDQVTATRIMAGLIFLFGLFTWIYAEDLGRIGAPNPTFLEGSPGTGLLLALTVILLWVPFHSWRTLFVRHMVIYANAGYWFLFAIVQWLPFHSFWSGKGYQMVIALHPIHTPIWLFHLFAQVNLWGVHQGLIATFILGGIPFALAIMWLTTTWRPQLTSFVASSTWMILLILWIVFQSAGFRGAFALALGSQPLLVIWATIPYWMHRKELVTIH